LFLAGLVPGIGLALAFIVMTAIICMIRPELGGERRLFALPVMLRALVHLVPIILLFTIIIGTIYKGWATPTEAAAVGVAGALAIAAVFGGVSVGMLTESLLGTIKITSMIMLVVLGASFLNFTLASAGLGQELRGFLEGLGLTPLMTIFVIVGIYIVLGFFIVLAVGMLLSRLSASVICASLGTAAIFTGMSLLLVNKNTEPVSAIADKWGFYSIVIAAMIAAGSVINCFIAGGGQRKADDRKSSKRGKGEEKNGKKDSKLIKADKEKES